MLWPEGTAGRAYRLAEGCILHAVFLRLARLVMVHVLAGQQASVGVRNHEEDKSGHDLSVGNISEGRGILELFCRREGGKRRTL